MALDPYDERTHDWVLELQSLDSLGDPQSAASLPESDEAGDDGISRWSTGEITQAPLHPDDTHRRNDTATRTNARPAASHRSRPSSLPSEPLPGAAECIKFVKTRRGRFRPARETRLQNNLLAAVGFLELANACDFSANVWNQTPVPTYAMVLMIVGGITALCFIYFSVKDGLRSWANVQALREERRYLKKQRALHQTTAFVHDANMVRTIACFLDMNTRELGTELVDRVGMDTMLGFSSFVVGIGTLLATNGDQNSGLFLASNLLTGYIGNAPCALYGLANLGWSSYVWSRARKQQRAALNYVKGSQRMSQMLRNRTSSIQFHAAMNGITGIVAGMSALVTATPGMWWGYVVLVPCVVTSGLVNLFWRRRVGYDRPLWIDQVTSIDQDAVLEALQYANACRERIIHGQVAENRDVYTTLVADPDSLLAALDVIRKNNLFEEYCLRLLQDKDMERKFCAANIAASAAVSTTGTNEQADANQGLVIDVDWRQLVSTADETWRQTLLQVAKDLINEKGLKSFIYQERHLLEVLGCYMCRGARFGRKGKRKSAATVRPNHNVHTYAGRHANDWLFGGFSFTETVKGLFKR